MSIDATAQIHPSAVIEPGARIGPGCEIGPFCWIGARVELAQNVVCSSHVVIRGQTKIGADTRIFSFSVIGEIPQDLKFKGEVSQLVIGNGNTIREHVTINLGTAGGGGVTSIGDDCLLMAGCHIAHDARLGNRVIIVNSAAIAGHVVIEDDVIVGGLCGVHQFVRLGRGAIIGAVTMVTHDVIPYGLVQASRGELDGSILLGLSAEASIARTSRLCALRFRCWPKGRAHFKIVQNAWVRKQTAPMFRRLSILFWATAVAPF